MLWWFAAGCFLLTDQEIKAHDREIRATPTSTADTGPAPITLQVNGHGLRDFNKDPVLGLVRRGNTETSAATDKVTAGDFFLHFPDPLELGERYRVDLLIDVDRDGTCSPGTDPSFRISDLIPDQGGPLEAELDLDANVEPDACSLF